MKQFKTIPLTLEKGVLFTMLFLLVVFGYLSSLDPFRESISGHATADDSDSSSELNQKETTLYILRRWKKKKQMRWKWQRKKLKKAKRKRKIQAE